MITNEGECEHSEELARAYAGMNYNPETFCGNAGTHAPHGICLGMMCDYGCNAEYF